MHLHSYELYLGPGERSAESRAHLLECPECRERLDEAVRFELHLPVLLHHLDHVAAPLTAADVIASAESRRAAHLQRRRRSLVGGVSLLLAASAAAAAIPAGPVHAWLVRLVAGSAPPRSAALAPTTPVPSPTAAPPASHGGISFVPAAGAAVRFTVVQPRGLIRIERTSSAQLQVEHVGGAPAYALARDAVTIDNADPAATYVVRIPRGVDHVRILVRDRLVYSLDGELVGGVAVAAGGDRWTIDFSTLAGGRH